MASLCSRAIVDSSQWLLEQCNGTLLSMSSITSYLAPTQSPPEHASLCPKYWQEISPATNVSTSVHSRRVSADASSAVVLRNTSKPFTNALRKPWMSIQISPMRSLLTTHSQTWMQTNQTPPSNKDQRGNTTRISQVCDKPPNLVYLNLI
jgi:hypothetical protein